MVFEVRLEQDECELPRFCVTHRGRILVVAPPGDRARRTLGLPVVVVVGTGECITLYAPPAAGPTPAAGDGSLASWPARCPIEPSRTV